MDKSPAIILHETRLSVFTRLELSYHPSEFMSYRGILALIFPSVAHLAPTLQPSQIFLVHHALQQQL